MIYIKAAKVDLVLVIFLTVYFLMGFSALLVLVVFVVEFFSKVQD